MIICNNLVIVASVDVQQLATTTTTITANIGIVTCAYALLIFACANIYSKSLIKK